MQWKNGGIKFFYDFIFAIAYIFIILFIVYDGCREQLSFSPMKNPVYLVYQDFSLNSGLESKFISIDFICLIFIVFSRKPIKITLYERKIRVIVSAYKGGV